VTVDGPSWDPQRFMTGADAGRQLGCSAQTVVNMIRDQRLAGFDRGAGRRPRWQASRHAVDQHAQAGHRESQPESQSLLGELRLAHQRIEDLEGEVNELRVLARQLARALSALTAATQHRLEDEVPGSP
jgi:hypothetical protein